MKLNLLVVSFNPQKSADKAEIPRKRVLSLFFLF